ncbi:MAG: hypothetical protein AMXMBFR61_23400 [Fimbriimonadales bacterium]
MHRMRIGVVSLAMLVCFTMMLDAAAQTLTKEVLDTFSWRSIGPASMGGRVSDIAVVESNPFTFYVGMATGGVLKTVNNGTSWTPVFDSQPVQSIGAVAIAPSNPEVVWVGTGEPSGRNSSGWGNGVYRTTDGGKTWQHLGLEDTHHIARILVAPDDPDTAYVAAVGRLWGYHPQRGVFKTTDGGKTWQHVLKVDDKTGAIDIAFGEPGSGIMFAAMYQRLRTPWGFQGVGEGSGLYRSTDNGNTWTKLTEGLPKGPLGRIGIAVSRSNPKVVMAVIESHVGGGGQVFNSRSPEGGVFRSEDSGLTWKRVNQNVPRGFYFSKIRIDPKDDKKVYQLGFQITRSTDGGTTFRGGYSGNIHPDVHAMWIDPEKPEHAIVGTDGGIYVTYDDGAKWDFLSNFPLGQFYEITADDRDPFHVYGGLQDNGSWGGPIATRTTTGVSNADWYSVGGGDGFYVQVDPRDPNIIYSETQNGAVRRLDRKNGQSKNIRPSAPEGTPSYRFNWNTPLLLSPHNPDVLYIGGNRLFRVTQQGDWWEPISPDLSKMHPERITTAGSGAETYGTIVTISESLRKPGLIWVGTDDGNVWVTRNGGKQWDEVGKNLPAKVRDLWVSRIEASRFHEGTAYLSFDGHRSDVFEPLLFVTRDYGKTWRAIHGDLPGHHPIQVVRESPLAAGVLLVGTSFGCFLSNDEGAHWLPLMKNLPAVEVDDILIHRRDHTIVAATHGRSLYVLDKATPLLELTPAVMEKRFHLFSLPPVAAYIPVSGSQLSTREFVAPNPPRGLDIYYWLRDEAEGEGPIITVTDSTGKTIHRRTGSSEKGLRVVRWDLSIGETATPSGQRGRGEEDSPPLVAPGTYTVTLTVGESSMTTELRVTGVVTEPSSKPGEDGT